MRSRDVLSAEDGKCLLVRAQDRLIPFLDNPDAAGAARIIGELFDGLGKDRV